MATYFPNSNNQRDATAMLYLREPLPTSYSEAPVLSGNVMMYMNYSSSSGSYSNTLASNPPQQNICIDIPSVGPSDSTPPQPELSNLGGSRIAEHDFNAWRARNEMLFMNHPMGGAAGILQGGQNLQGQGLSLSLGEGSGRNGSFRDDDNSQSKQLLLPGFPGANPDSIKPDISPYGISSIARTIPSSKYLKAAQQLLDEVVNVRKALKQHDSRELTKAEKQDLQNKLMKLLSMLDEVDRRYKQYYHQMQIVVSSFDCDSRMRSS
ncbi:hypothetical protein F0562_020538 [Nyssa sinensis]|uniref:POX domain-containing protein n=1 Tax=Nyssa sinensis TaxID=561372 RepID=A0A5J5BXK4_9ASTE|nr:hypothetical protein F0562_020538 [Nyssa sinensis]